MNQGFTLDPAEHILKVVRRHWFDLFPVFSATVILVASVPVIAMLYGTSQAGLPVSVGFVGVVMVLIMVLAATILLLGLYVYRQNYLILTNMHLIQVEQKGIFNRQVSQLSLARIQDVSGKRVGIAATLLNFGNMEVQSAGEHEKFIFRNAPSPNELADECLQAHENFLREFGIDHS